MAVRSSLVTSSRSTPVTMASRTQRLSQLTATHGGAQQGDMCRPCQGSTEARGRWTQVTWHPAPWSPHLQWSPEGVTWWCSPGGCWVNQSPRHCRLQQSTADSRGEKLSGCRTMMVHCTPAAVTLHYTLPLILTVLSCSYATYCESWKFPLPLITPYQQAQCAIGKLEIKLFWKLEATVFIMI